MRRKEYRNRHVSPVIGRVGRSQKCSRCGVDLHPSRVSWIVGMPFCSPCATLNVTYDEPLKKSPAQQSMEDTLTRRPKGCFRTLMEIFSGG